MLRDRNIRHLVLARLISSAGVEASFFVGLWGKAAYEFNGTPTDLAVMSGLIGLGMIAGSLVGGVLVDRWDARRVVLAAEVIFVPATLLLVFATSISKLLVLGVFSWFAGGVLETALVSMPPALVAPERLERANARLESANWLALVVGPALGAVIASTISVNAIFVFDAFTSIVALVLIARVQMRPRTAAPRDESTSSLREAREGLRYALRTPQVALVLFLSALTALAFGVFVALEPLYYRDVLGRSIETIGWVNALFGVGLFAGSIAVERSSGRLSAFRSLIVLSVLAGLGSAVYVGTANLSWVLVGAIAWSVPLGAALPVGRTLAQRATAEGFMGRVMGATSMVQQAAGIVPVVFAPALAAWLGVQGVLLASGFAVVVFAPLAWSRASALDAGVATADPVVGASLS